ncbi:hypothetical protein KC331_g56 [Hortaea werneckii]|nr:hypothetical protein KC331_g56 [Hortaea werneckii]
MAQYYYIQYTYPLQVRGSSVSSSDCRGSRKYPELQSFASQYFTKLLGPRCLQDPTCNVMLRPTTSRPPYQKLYHFSRKRGLCKMQISKYRHLDPHGVPNRAHRDLSGAPCDPQTTYQPHYSFSANRLLRYLVLITSKPSRLMSFGGGERAWMADTRNGL